MAKLSSTHIYGDLYVDGTISGALSGNASTATTLQTARTINGTSFNGSSNITTANWGTSRTITIGNTGKSVNGSGNVSWTLAEIGAAAATHGTHVSYGGNGSATTVSRSDHTHSYVPLSTGSSITIHADSDSSSTSEYLLLKGGHNELKIASNAGGSTVTKTNTALTFNGNVVYHAGNKPTPADIGAAASSHGTHLTLGTGSGNAYRGDYGNTAYNHSQTAHAPSNAQKNSDITKAEIEAKLTGTVTSHNHSGTYAASSHNHTSLTGITSLSFATESSDSSTITSSYSGTTSYMDFNMADDAGSDMWRWRFTAWDSNSGGSAATINAMTLQATSTTKSQLVVNGNIKADSFTEGGTALSSKYSASNHEHTRPTSGRWWNDSYVRIGTDGVSEVGKYIDFHLANGNTSDNDGRLTLLSANALHFNGTLASTNFESSGYLYSKQLGITDSTNTWSIRGYMDGSKSRLVIGNQTNRGYLVLMTGAGSGNGSAVQLEVAHTAGVTYAQFLSPEAGTIALTKHLSDRTRKENIVYIDSEESKFTNKDFYNFIKDNLDLATYNLKKEYAATDTHTKLNFIAQDILWDFEKNEENKVGNLIVQAEDAMEQQLSLKYDPEVFTSVIAGALKESINKIEELEDKNKKLEERLAMLEEKFSALENK